MVTGSQVRGGSQGGPSREREGRCQGPGAGLLGALGVVREAGWSTASDEGGGIYRLAGARPRGAAHQFNVKDVA